MYADVRLVQIQTRTMPSRFRCRPSVRHDGNKTTVLLVDAKINRVARFA